MKKDWITEKTDSRISLNHRAILNGCGIRTRNTKIRFYRSVISIVMTALYTIGDTGITVMYSVRLSVT